MLACFIVFSVLNDSPCKLPDVSLLRFVLKARKNLGERVILSSCSLGPFVRFGNPFSLFFDYCLSSNFSVVPLSSPPIII